MFYDHEPITVSQLIDKLKEMPQDAYLVTTDWDSEYGGTHYHHVYDLNLGTRKEKPLVFLADGLCPDDWYEEDIDEYVEEEE